MGIQTHVEDLEPVSWALMALAILLVIVRLTIRYTATRELRIEDIMVGAAMLMDIGATVALALAVQLGGLGKHRATLTQAQDDARTKANYVQHLLYIAVIATAKISMTIFFRRLAVKKIHHRITWALAVIIALWAISSEFVVAFQCPMPHPWDPTAYPAGSCLPEKIWLYVTVVDCLTEALIMALPFWIIWNVRIPRRKKWLIQTLFAFRVVYVPAQETPSPERTQKKKKKKKKKKKTDRKYCNSVIAASITRYAASQARSTSSSSSSSSPTSHRDLHRSSIPHDNTTTAKAAKPSDGGGTAFDTSYDQTGYWLWTDLHSTIAIIAACVPALKPFLEWSAGRIAGTMSSSAASGGRRRTAYGYQRSSRARTRGYSGGMGGGGGDGSGGGSCGKNADADDGKAFRMRAFSGGKARGLRDVESASTSTERVVTMHGGDDVDVRECSCESVAETEASEVGIINGGGSRKAAAAKAEWEVASCSDACSSHMSPRRTADDDVGGERGLHAL